MKTHANYFSAPDYSLDGGIIVTALQADASFLRTEVLRWQDIGLINNLKIARAYPNDRENSSERVYFNQEFTRFIWPNSTLRRVSCGNGKEVALYWTLHRMRSVANDQKSIIYTPHCRLDFLDRLICLTGSLLTHMKGPHNPCWTGDLEDALYYSKEYLIVVESRVEEMVREAFGRGG